MRFKGTKRDSLGSLKVPLGKLRQVLSSRMGDPSGADVYEIRPRKDGDGFDLTSDRLRHGPIWYSGPDAISRAVAYAKFRSLSRYRRAIIRVLDHSEAVIQTR